MLRTLHARLSLSLAVLLISVGVLYTLLSLSSMRYYREETEQRLNLDLAKNLVADRNLVESGRINETALSATFMEYMVINPSIEIYLLDLRGNILSYSADPGKVKRRAVSLAPIRAFLGGDKLPLLGDDPRSHERQKIFSVTAVPSQENPEGYLYVVLRGEDYDRAEQVMKQGILWKQTGWALGGSLAVGLLAGMLLFRRLTQRLDRLSHAMDTFRRDDFRHLAATAGHDGSDDEIDRLRNTFVEMARRITEQLAALKRQDSQRRELVANVSHDLRTPVAILHGYLETLELKGDRLAEEERRRYLSQALQTSERLSRIISELFDLAKLDAQESVPERERINLAELAQDVVQKFQIKAQQKNITLALEAGADSRCVHADIGLIARVFENLLGNALKFTGDNGRVTVKMLTTAQQPTIVVQDNGPGIQPDDLDKIFDRFYQCRENGSRAEPGGLGLYIAKRIIDLHGGTIAVASAPGQGAAFRFSLPAAEAAE